MTSANDTPSGDFDERLSQAIEAALTDGEQLVAQETGDQGQAIALTKTRILVAKAGFAATGELDGHKVSAFDLENVTAVNLRKGPLGAVIQIMADGATAPAQGGPPDNVIVFTGPGRVKRAEAFAAQVEFLSGKQVNRIDPTARPSAPAVEVKEAPAEAAPTVEAAQAPKAPAAAEEPAPAPRKGGREPKSLAEEIYAEIAEAEKKPIPVSSAPAPQVPEVVQPAAAAAPEVVQASQPVIEQPVMEEEPEPEPDQESEYRPNPNLPRPTRKQKQGPNGVLVLLGITAALVLIGMAVMAPLRQSQNDDPTPIKANSMAERVTASQINTVRDYREKVADIMSAAGTEAAAARNAISSGNKTALSAVGDAAKTDDALEQITDLEAPPGLAEAKQNLTNGLLAQKTAIASAAAAAQTGSVQTKDALAQLNEASAQTRSGLATISRIEAEMTKMAAPAKRK